MTVLGRGRIISIASSIGVLQLVWMRLEPGGVLLQDHLPARLAFQQIDFIRSALAREVKSTHVRVFVRCLFD